jgi:hypothetical protein
MQFVVNDKVFHVIEGQYTIIDKVLKIELSFDGKIATISRIRQSSTKYKVQAPFSVAVRWK